MFVTAWSLFFLYSDTVMSGYQEDTVMKKIWLLIPVILSASACHKSTEVDNLAPAAPRGISTVSLDNAVQLFWLENTESDIAGYSVWASDAYDGRYVLLGSTRQLDFLDVGAVNGETYYYAVSAYDFAGNESELSRDVVYDTPRPEGFGVEVYDYIGVPNLSGYDFSTYSIGRFDDEFTDVYLDASVSGYYLLVWSDTDIQDMGYTTSLDEISVSPTQGWSPTGTVEAIVGHTYVVWTWDDHYAKIRVTALTATSVVFDWAYQTAPANPELHRAMPEDGKRRPLRRDDRMQQ